MSEKKKIAVLTSSRADWGLLSRPAMALEVRDDVELTIVATNMHLIAEHGNTIEAIRRQGFKNIATVDMAVEGDTPADRARAMARCLSGMAECLERLKPDRVVILGDRYEMLAAASAAVMLAIPIVHLHGGEISQGAIDDSMRHAITKLSSLHLTSTESHRRRVIQMGEDPTRVINTGAIGVANVLEVEPMALDELTESLGGFKVDPERTLVVTYHPATLDAEASVGERFGALLEALDRHPECNVLITGANNDAGGGVIAEMTHRWQLANPDRVLSVPTLGMRRYLSVLRHAAAAVGNSSSGIIEVPSIGIPTVNIGTRQKGRTSADSVINCGTSADDIDRAITQALSAPMRLKASRTVNPYYRQDTLATIVDAIVNKCPATPVKQFHDL